MRHWERGDEQFTRKKINEKKKGRQVERKNNLTRE
jgi:hypothetical protein